MGLNPELKTAPKTTPKSAMVLAAGLGTRMRPLTDDRPKALVEVGGKALIDHMLDRLVEAGVERAVVNVHYFADRLEAHLKARSDVEIIISDERSELLETGGGLLKARALLGDDPVFVANIDSVWREDAPGPSSKAMADLIAAFDPEAMEACLMLARLERATGFDGAGDFHLSPEGRLTFRGSDPRAAFAYMGVHITRPQIVDGEALRPFSLSPIWRDLASQHRLYGTVMEGIWMHVGDPKARDEAEALLR